MASETVLQLASKRPAPWGSRHRTPCTAERSKHHRLGSPVFQFHKAALLRTFPHFTYEGTLSTSYEKCCCSIEAQVLYAPSDEI